jgi:hypothetical protein
MFRKITLWRILIIIVFSACFALENAQGQTTIQAGKCRNLPSYLTIQAAVDAAQAGAIVVVCPGIYPEQVTIKKSLTLSGVANGNADASVIAPPSGGMAQNASDPSPASLIPAIAAQVFIQGPATVNLNNLIIDGTNNQLSGCSGPTLVGVYALNSSGTFKELNVRNQTLDASEAACNSGLGVYVEGNTANAVTIKTTTVADYQKNGITANGFGDGSAGPAISFTGNTIVGQGLSAAAPQNGIQIGYGASGAVDSNLVIDSIYQGTNTSGAASTGILIFASKGITVSQNRLSNTQFAVATASDGTYGVADGSNINNDYVTASQIAAVEICSNNNSVQFNDLYSSGQAAVKLDSSCTEGPAGGSSGNGNTVTNNDFNGGCAGVLQGSGTGNTISGNPVVVNVFTSILPGNTCTPPFSSTGGTSTPLTGSAVPFR